MHVTHWVGQHARCNHVNMHVPCVLSDGQIGNLLHACCLHVACILLDQPIGNVLHACSLRSTVNGEIFVSKKNFRQSHSTTKIKPTKYFHRRINGLSLYCRVVLATKIKPGENLTDEMFYRRKVPDLRYIEILCYSATNTTNTKS